MLGFIFAMLFIIPLTVYLVQQQQETRTQATPNTTLSFVPASKTAIIGEQISFDIIVSPGNNQVNFIKLVLKYDPTKLSATENSFEVDPASNLSILEGPVLATDTLSVVLSVQSDPTKVIRTDTKIGSVTFEVIGASDLPTEITFDPDQIQIRSISGANQDAFNENVFLNGAPANVTIQSGEGDLTPTPTATPSATLSLTPTPTSTPSGNGATPAENQAPVCESLNLDVSTSGVVPYDVTFTAAGTDADGTIEKVTFSFGDGNVQDVASGSGITTDTVDVSVPYTYQSAGTFTASALLTDDQSEISDSASCSTTITVTDGSDIDGELNVSATPLPETGPTETFVGIGMLGGILFLIGALLFFAL